MMVTVLTSFTVGIIGGALVLFLSLYFALRNNNKKYCYIETITCRVTNKYRTRKLSDLNTYMVANTDYTFDYTEGYHEFIVEVYNDYYDIYGFVENENIYNNIFIGQELEMKVYKDKESNMYFLAE